MGLNDFAVNIGFGHEKSSASKSLQTDVLTVEFCQCVKFPTEGQ